MLCLSGRVISYHMGWLANEGLVILLFKSLWCERMGHGQLKRPVLIHSLS